MQPEMAVVGGNNLQALQTRDTTEKIVVWERNLRQGRRSWEAGRKE